MESGGVRMMRYAQINTDGVCVGTSNLNGEVTAAHMIAIADDISPIGKKWENGVWNDAAPPTVYKVITKQEALDLIIQYGEMDQAAELAFMKDPNLELFWLKWERAVPYADINRNSPKVPTFLGAVVATGHITQAQADSIMTNWPTVEE